MFHVTYHEEREATMNPTLNHQKRRHARYDVSWRALLEVSTPDFNDFMLVPMVNLSRSGAMIRSSRIYMHKYHLSVAAQNHELNLIIHAPKSELDSRVMVRRYSWNDAKNGYDVGLEFRNLSPRNQRCIDGMIKDISADVRPLELQDFNYSGQHGNLI